MALNRDARGGTASEVEKGGLHRPDELGQMLSQGRLVGGSHRDPYSGQLEHGRCLLTQVQRQLAVLYNPGLDAALVRGSGGPDEAVGVHASGDVLLVKEERADSPACHPRAPPG